MGTFSIKDDRSSVAVLSTAARSTSTIRSMAAKSAMS